MQTTADAIPMPQALHQVTRFGPELLGLLAVGLFAANMAAGKRSNEALAIKWARMFCGDGAVLERNFAQIIARADGGSEVRRHADLSASAGGMIASHITAVGNGVIATRRRRRRACVIAKHSMRRGRGVIGCMQQLQQLMPCQGQSRSNVAAVCAQCYPTWTLCGTG